MFDWYIWLHSCHLGVRNKTTGKKKLILWMSFVAQASTIAWRNFYTATPIALSIQSLSQTVEQFQTSEGGGTLQGTSPMPDWSMVVHVHVWLILCCIFSALNFTLRPFTPLTEPASSACFCEQDNAQKNSAKANGFPISKEPTPSPHFIHTLALSCMVWQKASLHRRHAKFDLRGQCCQGWQSQSIDVS